MSWRDQDVPGGQHLTTGAPLTSPRGTSPAPLRGMVTQAVSHERTGTVAVSNRTRTFLITLGLLNVLTAVDAAAAGALPDQIAACLAERSPGPLTDVLLGMTSEEVAEVRAVFRAYGCCTVTDPIGELVELGLLKEEH